MATTLERGTAFELQLRRLFEAHGYQATHNVRLTGRSGAEHQIDVLAELPLPLQTVRLIVEAKAYDQPVDKDALLKLTQIVDDLGADRGVLATTSYFTPGALKMAAGRNVDLWDRDHVSRLLGEAALGLADDGAEAPITAAASETGLLGVIPRVSMPEARAAVEAGVARRRKGGLLGVGRVEEELAEMALVYATFYELTLDAPVYEEERRGLLAKEVVRKIVPVRLSVGAHSGRIVTIDLAGRVQGTPYTLPELAADEADALKALPQGWFTRDDLLALGYPQGKAQRIVSGLQAKGLLASQRLERKVRYSLTGLIPIPNGFRAITEAFAAEPLRAEPKLLRGAARSQAAIIRAAEALAPGATVTGLTVLYYPYYGYTVQRQDGSRRQGLLDGLSGEVKQPADR